MSSTTERPPVNLSSKMIQLFTAYPCAGEAKGNFGLSLPAELSDCLYAAIVKQVEFRRKCMNQGFDNLLELLAIHKKAFDGAVKVVEADDDESESAASAPTWSG
jgi:hypothetical protein